MKEYVCTVKGCDVHCRVKVNANEPPRSVCFFVKKCKAKWVQLI